MKTKTGSQEMNGERGGLRGSKQLLRLEVRVEGPELGSAALRAPLTGRSCVLHSAAVSKQLHDGMPAVPVAFSASSVDFTVTLVDDKETCIHIKGEDVSLFDTVNGKCIERTTFDAAPDSWQVRSRDQGQGSSGSSRPLFTATVSSQQSGQPELWFPQHRC
eukprot:g10998.t2